MKKRISFFGLFIFFNVLISFSQEKKEIADWLSKNAIPIKDSTYTDDAEYKQLLKYLSEKTIIGAGEATHGTADFQAIKYNLFKYLVRNMSFRALALEMPNDDTQPVNDFIINGKGSSEEAIKKLSYWTYHTKETQELLEWLKKYNTSVTDSNKVRIYGIDPKPSIDTESLKDSLLSMHLISESSMDSLSLIPLRVKDTDTADVKKWGALNDLVEKILQTVVDNEATIKSLRSDEYIKSLELSLMSLRQVTKFQLIPRREQSESYRDSCMAENAVWLIRNAIPNKKLFLGMHNGHIQNIDFETERYASGYYLKKLFGSTYYSIGFQFARGNFSASIYNPVMKRYSEGTVTFNKGNANSFGELFYSSGFGNFYIDLNTQRDSTYIRNIFYKDVSLRTVGCCYDIRMENTYYQEGILKDLYDGMFFIETTKNTTILK